MTPRKDRLLSGHLASGKPFEPVETSLIMAEAGPGMTALDIGANVGYYTLLLARCVGPSGRVIALEPEPANARLLRENVARNGYANVEIHEAAASDRAVSATLYRCAFNSGDSRLFVGSDHTHGTAVPCVRLDELLGDARPDVIKMDIQGGEPAALAGMDSLLRGTRRLSLLTEFWPYGMAANGGDPRRFIDTLIGMGFDLYHVSEPHGTVRPADVGEILREFPPNRDVFTTLFCKRG